MKYKEYNDYELLDYISENNEEASELLYKKYEPIIKNIAGRLYPYCKNNGIDINDLVQEGMIGLSKAIQSYEDCKDATFYTYATRCIKSCMLDLKTKSSRLKHRALNDSLPMELDIEGGSTLENFIAKEENNPLNLLITKEREDIIISKLKEEMTDFERKVFDLKYQNYDYKEIAILLDKDIKSIDNALQRIKNKLNKVINE